MNDEIRKASQSGGWVVLSLVFILLVGSLLRFAALDRVPPGMWFDEALKAQDAYATAHLTGPRLLYTAEFPREPLFIWILALTSRFLSEEVWALRATSGVIGLITILALFFCVRTYAGTRAALLSSAVLATLFWHALFSRLLFRSLTLVLVGVVIVWAAGWARRHLTWVRAAVFGAAIGAGFYTYLAWYFMLPGVAALFWWVFRRADADRHVRRLAIIGGVAAIAVASPMLIRYTVNLNQSMLRPLAVLPSRDQEKSAAAEIAENFIESLGMFHVRGDHVGRQNIPDNPALDPVQGVFFLIGLGACAWSVRRREPFAAILLGWLFLGMLPTILTYNDSPNFLRTLVMTPALATITAMGLLKSAEFVERKLPDRTGGSTALALCILAVGASAAITAHKLYVRVPNSEQMWSDFNGPMYQLGRAAERTPEGTAFWMPVQMASHRTFQYLTRHKENVAKFGDFDFLRTKRGPRGTRWVVATSHNRVHEALDRFVPGARIVMEFRRPGEPENAGVWGLLYEIPEEALPPPDVVDRIEDAHPVKNLGF